MMSLFKTGAGRSFLDIAIIAAGFMVLLPILGINRTTDFMIFCIFVLGFNILYGFMGRLSFGHMLYLGTGAYAITLFSEHVSQNPLLAILAGICAGALIGVIIGPVIVRTTGACFALINLAFDQVGYFLVLVAFSKYTGGEDGMSVYFSKMGFLDFGQKPVMFGFTLLCLLLTYYLLKKFTSSPYGILIKSIKENETRVKFLGYNTFNLQMDNIYHFHIHRRVCRGALDSELRVCNPQFYRPFTGGRSDLCRIDRRVRQSLRFNHRGCYLYGDQQLSRFLYIAMGDVSRDSTPDLRIPFPQRHLGICGR